MAVWAAVLPDNVQQDRQSLAIETNQQADLWPLQHSACAVNHGEIEILRGQMRDQSVDLRSRDNQYHQPVRVWKTHLQSFLSDIC